MRIFLLVLTILISSIGNAQKKPVYRGQVGPDGATVYRQPTFDSEILTTLPPGKTFSISAKPINTDGAFYKVLVKPGLTGYVGDHEIRPLFKTANAKKEEAEAKEDKEEPRSKRKRPFVFTKYAGLEYAFVQFKEKTLGKERTENLDFFGVKISGPDLLIEGPIMMDVNFLFHYGAPTYYEKLTGRGTDGFAFLVDFLFQYPMPVGQNSLVYYGFGPAIRYSKFDVQVRNAGNNTITAYSLEDITAGAVFNLGLGFRLGSVALRAEGRYYWEKTQYFGATTALQFGF